MKTNDFAVGVVYKECMKETNLKLKEFIEKRLILGND